MNLSTQVSNKINHDYITDSNQLPPQFREEVSKKLQILSNLRR